MNDIPQRFQSVLTKKNNESKLSIGLLDARFINEPLLNDFDVNNNKITNLKDAENEFDAINKIQLDYYVKSNERKLQKLISEGEEILKSKIEEQEQHILNKIIEPRDIDMNSKRIINLAPPVTPREPVTLEYLNRQVADLLKIINDIRNRITVIADKSLELDIKVNDAFYIHTFEITDSSNVDVVKVMPYFKYYTYVIQKILVKKAQSSGVRGRIINSGVPSSDSKLIIIAGVPSSDSKVIFYDLNSVWCNSQLVKNNATIEFYEVVESDQDSDLGLYMQRINNKPAAFCNTIKVIYSKFRV